MGCQHLHLSPYCFRLSHLSYSAWLKRNFPRYALDFIICSVLDTWSEDSKRWLLYWLRIIPAISKTWSEVSSLCSRPSSFLHWPLQVKSPDYALYFIIIFSILATLSEISSLYCGHHHNLFYTGYLKWTFGVMIKEKTKLIPIYLKLEIDALDFKKRWLLLQPSVTGVYFRRPNNLKVISSNARRDYWFSDSSWNWCTSRS